MSSPASDVTRLELPRLLLAEKLGLVLCLACGLLLEILAPRYPGLPQGVGLALGAALVLAQLGTRAALSAIEWDAGGQFRVLFRDGRRADGRVGEGTRLLGPTVYLDLSLPSARPLRVWLLPPELAPSARRRLVLSLRRALSDAASVRRIT
jgi:hypothetical protein